MAETVFAGGQMAPGAVVVSACLLDLMGSPMVGPTGDLLLLPYVGSLGARAGPWLPRPRVLGVVVAWLGLPVAVVIAGAAWRVGEAGSSLYARG